MANLPGANVPNTPPLPNTTQQGPRPVLPVSWDSFQLASRAVFDLLAAKGQPAADALLAWIKQERAKP